MGFNGFAQCFPVVVQGFADDAVQIFLIGIDRQDALRIGGFVEPRAGALLDSQLVRGLQQIVLNRFERFVRQVVGAAVGVAFAMLRQIVSEVDHADTQRTTPHRTAFSRRDGVILIVEQRIQSTHRQHRQLFQLVEAVDSPEVEGRQGAQRDFAVFVVDIFQRFGRQGDLQAQVRLTHRGDYRIERAVGVTVVDVLDIDAAGRGALLHHQREQLNGFNTLLTNAVVLLVLGV